jgi:hypothetical protein
LLRDHDVVANLNVAKAVKGDTISDPGVVANRDFPGIGDFDRRPDQYTPSDDATKQSKQKPAPAKENLWGKPKQSCLHNPPELNHPSRPAAKSRGLAERLQILHGRFFVLFVVLVDRAILPRNRSHIHADDECFELFKRWLGGSGMA